MKRRSVLIAVLLGTAGMGVALADTALAQSPSLGAAGNVDVENIPAQFLDGTERPYVYAVKMLCGTIPAISSFKQFPAPNADELLVPGTYLSMINILNPGPEISILRNGGVEVDAIRPAGGGFGTVGGMGEHAESQLDCVNFLTSFQSGPAPNPSAALKFLKHRFLKGFYLVKSSAPLVVVSVNSFKNVEGR